MKLFKRKRAAVATVPPKPKPEPDDKPLISPAKWWRENQHKYPPGTKFIS